MPTSPARVLVVLAALVLVLAACGSDAAETTTTVPTAQPTSTTSLVPTTTSSPTTPTTTSASDPTTTTPPISSVDVYFAVGDGSDCSQVEAFQREVSPTADPVTAAFEALVGGPMPDEAKTGASSFFSAVTADAVRTTGLDAGLLVVDLEDYRAEMANASTSCGSASLLASLNGTAFQFEDVERARYTIFGSCNAFYSWLQGECLDQTRTGPVAVDLNTNQEASGSGCTPGTDVLPDGEWFGYAESAGADELEFDLACWFSGVAAADAAAEDGFESPPPNDYYVRNVSDDLRTVPVRDGADVTQLIFSGPDSTNVSYDEWSAGWANREYRPGLWLTITDGELIQIVEQYVP